MATDPSSSSRRLLRPLLPRLRFDQAVAPPDSDEPHPRRVNAACEPCRARKVKCNARRPSCSKCVVHQYECVYDTAPAERRSDALKRKLGDMESQRDAYKKLFDALKTKSEAEAADIFRRVRRVADIDAILRYYTFPYLRQMPAFLLRNRPYAESLIYRSTSQALLAEPVTGLPAPGSVRMALLDDDPYLAPYHAAEIVDPCFGFAKAADWASVVDDDRFFVTLLKAYFQVTHPFWPVFHKDCFLDHLVSSQHQFCSPLVNAVLAAACHEAPVIANRADFWDPQSLECRLLNESRRLFELEMSLPAKLSTVQAGVVISIANDANGCDDVGNTFLVQAVTCATELDLSSAPDPTLGRRAAVSRTFTAWGLFSMQSVYRFHVFMSPLIVSPPQAPLPDPETDEGCMHYYRVVDVNPQHILTSAKNCMELLLRLYFLHHGFELFEMFLIHLILHTGFINLKEHLATAKTANSNSGSPRGTSNMIPSDLEQDRWSLIVLAAKGLHDQALNCYLVEAIFVIFKDNMRAENLWHMHGLLCTSEREDYDARRSLVAVQLRSAWPGGDFDLDGDVERSG
ncbi:hypothetical protein Micbo1qcDRAFT_210440 [Microdochium bolleyi]|uniref:Zn(2)-C6 fungal-type domain-containing protein n=1 Tax=Microdochium bolleyi TaxID=196109 RepID=A0A136IIL7_9PEZI|nr:hypothetical protein Micbo1qcDRAFT_210440 [Microdochium bolleyi]